MVECVCGETPFVEIAANQYRCRSCFIRLVKRKVRKAICDNQMIESGDTIALGLSGGKDSAVLLATLSELAKKMSDISIIAITIDEGVKNYRETGLPIARELANRFDVKYKEFSFASLFGLTLDELVQKSRENNTGKSACAICGPFRRKALNIAAREVTADVLATGHNLEDEAQTITLNLVRGDFPRFIRLKRNRLHNSLNYNLIPRIKPLLYLTDVEIIYYCNAENIRFHETSCPYAAGARRNSLRSFLSDQEEAFPGTLRNVFNVHNKILKQLDHSPKKKLLDHSPKKISLCSLCNEPTEKKLCWTCTFLKIIRNSTP